MNSVTNVTQIAAKAMFSWGLGRCYRDCVHRTVDFALDTEQMIRHRMATRGISFEQAVNDSIRQGFDRGGVWEPFRTLANSTGGERVSPDRDPRAAAEIDDEDVLQVS